MSLPDWDYRKLWREFVMLSILALMAGGINIAIDAAKTLSEIQVSLASEAIEQDHMLDDIAENCDDIDKLEAGVGTLAIGQSDLKARVIVLEMAP